jgi:hypothetical protein
MEATTKRTEMTDINIEQVSSGTSEMDRQYGAEFSVAVNGTVVCYIRTREAAEQEAARIVKGIEADRKWMANR